MLDAIRPFLARIVASLIVALAGWLTTHWGVDFTGLDSKELAENLVEWMLPLLLVVYSLVHRVLNKWINPGDAASGHLAGVEKLETKNLKALS